MSQRGGGAAYGPARVIYLKIEPQAQINTRLSAFLTVSNLVHVKNMKYIMPISSENLERLLNPTVISYLPY